ncbi:MAG TPA: hypothetical protein VN822_10840 [Candidatus Acidoferrales bacterium]|nr:hypothetical protein [Candidatus Acidoferrales bacterium]
MPYHFEFDSANRIIRCWFEGPVGDENLKEYYRVAAKYFESLQPRAGIVDFSAATSFEVAPQTVRELAKLPPAMPHPERPRFVIAPSAQIFGMARMFELQGQETRPNLHVVRTAEEAWAILGVQAPKFEPIKLK